MPGVGRVIDKEQEKVEKYQDLARELKKIWDTSVTVCSHCGWSIRSRMQCTEGADQAKNRQERDLKIAIC